MKRHYLIGALLVSAAAGAAVAEPRCQLAKIAELPVTMVGMQPHVHAGINGKDDELIADSGAWYSMISAPNAIERHLVLRRLPNVTFTGMGGDVETKLTVVDTFTIGGLSLRHVQFVVGGSDTGALGLLGQNVLGVADTEFDLAHGAIRLMRGQACEKADLAYWAPPGTPFSVLSTEPSGSGISQIIAPIYVNGVKMRALFDTGANSSFMTIEAAARIGLKIGDKDVKPAGLVGGIGRWLTSSYTGPVASVKIGDEEIRNTRLRFGGHDANVDMLIGADFFLSHRLYWSKETRRLFFTFNGGHVFDLRYLQDSDTAGKSTGAGPASADSMPAAATATSAEPTPVDADAFTRRGAARAARGDFTGAQADLDQALKLSPDDIESLRQRAILRSRTHAPERAIDDLDRLLKLKPDDVDALLLRATLRLDQDRPADARRDLDAASASASKASERRLALAEKYEAAGDHLKAIAEYDLWIPSHPDDSRHYRALDDRCWARAMAKVDFDRAVKDCNATLSDFPGDADFYNTRGMLRLRMGEFGRAVSDYDAALKIRPKLAWAFYGRGIAKLKLGQKDMGEADLAKAKELEPDLPDRARKLGVTP